MKAPFRKEDLPRRIQSLAINDAGYPVPWFVAYVDGKPDFRMMDEKKFVMAVRENLCWICGEMLGRYKAFVIGPMCAVNRVSSEPPSHVDCAEFAAKACPFLTNPKQKRRETNLPDAVFSAPGIPIRRNPGVTLMWVTTKYQPFNVPGGGVLFKIGPHESLSWYAMGREATREEILESMESGVPALRAVATEEGADAVAELEDQYRVALGLVPE